jgi:hypothetical protein
MEKTCPCDKVKKARRALQKIRELAARLSAKGAKVEAMAVAEIEALAREGTECH